MPCMCGDSQCPSCGSAQDTLENKKECPFCDGSGCRVCDPTAEELGELYDREREERELWQQIDNLGKNTDTLKRLGTAFERMFRAEGIGPRTKMRRWKEER